MLISLYVKSNLSFIQQKINLFTAEKPDFFDRNVKEKKTIFVLCMWKMKSAIRLNKHITLGKK